MSLTDVWPLFGLTLTTPRLTLRIVRDEDIPPLLEAALAGVHEPQVMPFDVPWTDAAPDKLRRNFAQHQWRQRVSVQPNDWTLNFAVILDGVPIGVQDLAARDFSFRRTVSSGSWLTQSQQGKGLGTEMRAAILLIAFDHLGAEVAESGATSWNAASRGVSRRLGYSENGRGRRVTRPGEVTETVAMRLLKKDFVRPKWDVRVDGLDAALKDLIDVVEAG